MNRSIEGWSPVHGQIGMGVSNGARDAALMGLGAMFLVRESNNTDHEAEILSIRLLNAFFINCSQPSASWSSPSEYTCKSVVHKMQSSESELMKNKSFSVHSDVKLPLSILSARYWRGQTSGSVSFSKIFTGFGDPRIEAEASPHKLRPRKWSC